jgi:hypothetical protein
VTGQYPNEASQYRIDSQTRVTLTLQESKMSIEVLKYNWQITRTIQKAKWHGAISQGEADYLKALAATSDFASSTIGLISAKGAPDFLYAALYFSTMVWQSREAAGCDANAKSGYKLARFILTQESPAHEPFWAAKLLRELYDAHAEPTLGAVASVA